MNPRITVRNIPSPLTWKSAGTGTVWHHIIPFAVLKEVWNRLVDQFIATSLPEAALAIRQFLLLSDRNVPATLIDRIRVANAGQQHGGPNPLQPLTVPDVQRLQEAAVWPAWDIVEGPRRRSDDPQDRYFDRFTAGLTAEESARMRMIEILLQHFQTFINAGPAPGAFHLRDLAQAVSGARLVVYCEKPLPYRPDMWVQDPGGLWRKRR